MTQESNGFLSTLTDLLSDLIGPAARELGASFGDRVRIFRWKQAVKTLQRAKEFAEEQGVAPTEVPIKFLVPFLEHASLEDDAEDLSDLWAKLLVSALDSYQSKHVSYITLLSQLSREQAELLTYLFSSASENEIFRAQNFTKNLRSRTLLAQLDFADKNQIDDMSGVFAREGAEFRYFDEANVPNFEELIFAGDDYSLNAAHLESLGLVDFHSDVIYDHDARNSGDTNARGFLQCIALTPLGFDFTKTCASDKV